MIDGPNWIYANRFSMHSIPAVPILDKEAYIVSMDYSPLLAGFSIVLKDGRAAYLTSSNLKFDPNVSFSPSSSAAVGDCDLPL